MFNDRFLKACHREQVDYTPVWLMRQAGRYMSEYMVLRNKYDFLTMCKTPELACEVTLQPIDKLGVDAAILFADILLPLEGMGLDLTFAKNEGPVIANPVRNEKDVENIRILDAEEATPYVMEAIRLLTKRYGATIPDVLKFADDARAELDALENSEERIAELQKQETALLKQIGELSERISRTRKKAADKLSSGIVRELGDLRMASARFEVGIEQVEEPTGCFVGDRRLAFDDTGIDRVEFMMSANPGEPLRPLAKVASGGVRGS
mgnify:CR=1 FL=1